MDFSQIRERVQALVRLGGWSNASPSPDFAFLANEGLRLLTRETQHNIEEFTFTTVADQATYSIIDPNDRRGWINFNDDVLYDTSRIAQSTRNKIRTADPLWRQTAAGTPYCWYWAGPTTIGLYPKPSTTGVTVSMEGARHEPELIEDSDIPQVSEEFHEAICLLGAWYWGKLHARGEERAIMEGYLSEANSIIRRAVEAQAEKEVGMVQRRIARSSQGYI